MNHDSGQTIIELLIALTLIILFLSGVMIVQLYALRNVEYARQKSTATKLAREQFERARVVRDIQGMDALSQCMSSCYINNQLTAVPASPNGLYIQELEIASSSLDECVPRGGSGGTNEFYKLTATVYWDSYQISLTSCLGDSI